MGDGKVEADRFWIGSVCEGGPLLRVRRHPGLLSSRVGEVQPLPGQRGDRVVPGSPPLRHGLRRQPLLPFPRLLLLQVPHPLLLETQTKGPHSPRLLALPPLVPRKSRGSSSIP